jgi:hypothetical protein
MPRVRNWQERERWSCSRHVGVGEPDLLHALHCPVKTRIARQIAWLNGL